MPIDLLFRGCAALLLPIFVILLCCSDTRAFQPGDDCLWISYGERIRGRDNEAVIPVKINFGRFPGGSRELSSLAGLKVYCFVNDGGTASEWRRRTLDMGGRDKDGFIPITTREHDHVLIYAVAELQTGGRNIFYSAKSGFSRFTRKKPVKSVDIRPAAADPVGLDIIPRFHYWRQVGEKLRISIKPSCPVEPSGSLYLLDEHAVPEMIEFAKDGTASYLLPDDKILNEQSSKASKTVLVLAEKQEGKHRYVSSCSLLLHRSRTMHYSHAAGLSVLAGTVILSLGVVVWRRRMSGF